MKKEVEEKINQLQIMEMNLQNILLQKRTMQIQLLEVDNAIKELKNSKEDAYKVIGSIMVKTERDKLIKELDSKKEMVEIRLKSMDKQEKEIMEHASKIQQEIIKESKQ
ncbi:prefoldin subunit beta [Candidatus Woesearchaeota archaeon]|nr:prefoldin subunit beta [Candidatus Woesearchaeota archaeon]